MVMNLLQNVNFVVLGPFVKQTKKSAWTIHCFPSVRKYNSTRSTALSSYKFNCLEFKLVYKSRIQSESSQRSLHGETPLDQQIMTTNPTNTSLPILFEDQVHFSQLHRWKTIAVPVSWPFRKKERCYTALRLENFWTVVEWTKITVAKLPRWVIGSSTRACFQIFTEAWRPVFVFQMLQTEIKNNCENNYDCPLSISMIFDSGCALNYQLSHHRNLKLII